MSTKPLKLIAGPCIIDSLEESLLIANTVKPICDRLGIEYLFKGSFKKANRTSVNSFTGIGNENALQVLQAVGKELNVATVTDVHETTDCAFAAQYVDVLQIPAFLCRQTDLLVAAGNTGKAVNIKKGQWVSPEAMQFAVEKVKSTGNKNVWLTERGNIFGYQDLVVDMTAIPRMQQYTDTVVLDATHATQKTNQQSGVSGGSPEYIEKLCLAGIAVGADALFIEVHPEPAKSKSDAGSILQLDKLEAILEKCVKVRDVLQSSNRDR